MFVTTPFGRGRTAATLVGIGVLHVLWGRGSTFPFADRGQLNDTVIGRDATPAPAACYAVAGLLVTAGALVAGLPSSDNRLRRVGVGTVAAVLGARAALGFAGRTDIVSPGSVSEKFRDTDRRYLAPLCLALSLGALGSLRR